MQLLFCLGEIASFRAKCVTICVTTFEPPQALDSASRNRLTL